MAKKLDDEKRPMALEMTKQFRMSARYWDIAQLKARFQPDRFEPNVDATCASQLGANASGAVQKS